MQQDRPKIIAHRANGFGAPENTLSAFEQAAESNIFGVELDARLTKDLCPVVCHDPQTPSSSSGEIVSISSRMREELAHLPDLADALSALGKLTKDVEIKPTTQPINNVITCCAPFEEIRYSSFDWDCLEQCKELAPDVPRALLVPEGTQLEVLLQRATELKAEGVHLSLKQLTSPWVERIHSTGLDIRIYTANQSTDWTRAVDFDIDAIMTDESQNLRSWLDKKASLQ